MMKLFKLMCALSLLALFSILLSIGCSSKSSTPTSPSIENSASTAYVPVPEDVNLIVTLTGTPPDLYTSAIESADTAFPQIRQVSDQIKEIYRNNRDNPYAVTVQSQVGSLVNIILDLKEQRADYIRSLLGASLDDIQRNAIEKIESIPGTTVTFRDLVINSLCVKAPRESITQIRALSEVHDIFEDIEAIPVTETTSQTMKLRPNAYPETLWNMGFQGEGISVMGIDTGVYAEHDAFIGLDLQSGTFPDYATGCDPGDSGDHGTHTAGVVASQDPTNRGMAWGIDTYYNAKFCSGYDGLEALMHAYDWAALGGGGANDAEIINFSMIFIYNCHQRDGLDMISEWVDNTIDLYDVTWSLGTGNRNLGCEEDQINDKPAVCWNGVSVAGIVDHDTGLRDDDTYYTNSKYGPCYGPGGSEDRLKPEIMAPTQAMSPSSSGGWGNFPGTSCAAPHFSGFAASLLSAGVTSSIELRALTYATAEDYTSSPGTTGPDYYAGFGSLDAWSAYEHIPDTFSGTFHNSGDNTTFSILNVQDGDRVVLVYNKHKSGVSWKISNLDLRVYDKATSDLMYETTNQYENKEYIQFGPEDAGKDVVITVNATQIASGLTSESWAVAANTIMTEYVEDHPKAAELLAPEPGHNYTLGENLYFQYVPASGTNPSAYWIDLWIDGEHFKLLPEGGFNLGMINEFYLPFTFMELRAPDGLWEWSVASMISGQKYWSEKSYFLKYTAPELILPAHNTEMAVNDIFDWTESVGALNYVMRITGLMGGEIPFYLPLNYTLTEFNLVQPIYDFLETEKDYTWSIAGTALGETLPMSDQEILSMLSYSVPWTFRKAE